MEPDGLVNTNTSVHLACGMTLSDFYLCVINSLVYWISPVLRRRKILGTMLLLLLLPYPACPPFTSQVFSLKLVLDPFFFLSEVPEAYGCSL